MGGLTLGFDKEGVSSDESIWIDDDVVEADLILGFQNGGWVDSATVGVGEFFDADEIGGGLKDLGKFVGARGNGEVAIEV